MRPMLPFVLFLVACESDKVLNVRNPAPVAEINSHNDGDSIYDGEAVVFTAALTDANHEITELEARWTAGGQEICPFWPADANGESTCEAIIGAAESLIQVEVRDPANAASTSSVQLQVTESAAPVLRLDTPTDGDSNYSDQKILFSGWIGDAEDETEELVLRFESDLMGGVFHEGAADASGNFHEAFYLDQGSHLIKVSVEDRSGKVDTEAIIYTVIAPNSAPNCQVIQPEADLFAVEGTELTFSGLATDVDISADQLSVAWSSNHDGLFGASQPTSDGQVFLNTSELSANSHNIRMTVTDEVGATCTDVVSLRVGAPPKIETMEPCEGEVFPEGEPVVFTATISDNEDSPEDLQVQWVDGNGTVLATGSANADGVVSYTAEALVWGEHQVQLNVRDSDGLETTESAAIAINALPSIPNVSISPNPAYTGDDIAASASGSIDPEGQAVSYSYEWLLNGSPSGITTATLPASQTAKGQEWTVQVTPNDGQASGPSGQASVLISNTSPVASAVQISPATGINNNSVVSCSGSYSDPDEVPSESYSWQVNGVQIASGATVSLDSSLIGPVDTLRCVYQVTDSDGAIATAENSVTLENRSPVMNSVAITPASGVFSDTTLQCQASATDADGETPTVSYEWSHGTTGQQLATTASLQLSNDLIQPGDSVICTATATDGQQAMVSSLATITVDNTLPIIDSIALSPSNGLQSGDVVDCLVSASDSDGDQPVISYEWSVNGSVAGTGASFTLNNVVSGDLVACQATAVDAASGSTSATASIHLDNTAPVIAAVTLSPVSPMSQDDIQCVVTGASDADGHAVNISYAWFVDGVQQAETSDVLAAPFAPGATVMCQVTPNDGYDAGTAVSNSIAIANSQPVVSSVSLSPAMVYTNDTVIATASASDVDGQSLSLRYDWYVDGNQVQSGSNGSLNSSAFVKEQSVHVTVTANDGLLDSSPVSSSNLTIMNTAPVVSAVSLLPNTAKAGETISCQVAASDIDNESLQTSYAWEINGTVVSTTAQLTLANAVYNDTIRCQATVTDSSGATASGSQNLQLGNTLPVISSVSITPNNPTSQDTLTCQANGVADADGQTVSLTYNWSVDGVQQASANGTLSGSFDPGAQVTCQVTPNDGVATGMASSAMVAIENSIPVVNSVTLAPTTVYTDDNLVATASASDDDGQSLSLRYDWFVAGAMVQSGSSASLDSNSFSKHQDVYVKVVANDGASDSTPMQSANVTVQNTSPVLDTIVLSPALGLQNGSTVSCQATASDKDNETPTISYEWQHNGAVIGSTASMTLTSLVYGDSLTCIATASDSDGAQAASSTSTQITNSKPAIAAVALSPAIPTAHDSLTCAASGMSDADGHSVSVSYRWFVNGAQQAATTNTLPASYVVGDSIRCEAVPFDGVASGDAVAATTVVVNSRPVVNSVSLSPADVYTNDSITATASATDADGQTVSLRYDWYVDGAMVQSSDAAVLSGVDHFSKNQSVHVLVVPNDGQEDGDALASNAVVILNTAPEAPVVSLAPAVPVPGVDNLQCVIDSIYDADGDSFAYDVQWTVNGNAFAGAAATTSVSGDTIVGQDTSNLDVWSCSLTITDDSGASATSNTASIDVGCTLGSGEKSSCPASDCSDILFDGLSQGNGRYWIDPTASGDAYEVQCLMDTGYDDGGWTLIMVSSDDGVDSWSHNDLALFTNDSDTFGSLDQLNQDLKSQALHEVGINDLLFVHSSGTWASYRGVEDGTGSYSDFAELFGPATCYEHGDGYAMFAGNLSVGGQLCSTELFMNARDRDGGGCSAGNGSDAYGPAWSTGNGGSCLFSNPGAASLGPNAATPATESASLGFGAALSLNNGASSSASNYMQVYVRLSMTDVDGDGYRIWEDCDDNDPNTPLLDNDCDGYTVAEGDCDDQNGTVHPFANDYLGDSLDSNCDGLDCAAGTYDGTYFLACDDYINWSDASDRCVDLGYDGLATIISEEESQALSVIRAGTQNFHWIGLHDQNTEGSFEWTSGMPVSYSNWSGGNPNNAWGQEHCAGVSSPQHQHVQSRNTWNDAVCSLPGIAGNDFGFVCEIR